MLFANMSQHERWLGSEPVSPALEPSCGRRTLVRASEGGSEVQTACGGDAYQTVRPSFSSSPAGLALSSEWLQ